MRLASTIRRRIADRAPRLDDRAQQAAWRLRNRGRWSWEGAIQPQLTPLSEDQYVAVHDKRCG